MKEIKLEEDAISEILVAETDSEFDAKASNVYYFEEEEEEQHSSSCRPQQSPITGCNNWLITNLGTASRKEHKYSSFCQSSKRWTIKCFSTFWI